jgi:hypothetical protein
MSNVFIAVEGIQDVEVISALLESEGFHKEVRMENLRDDFCSRLINRTFPHQGDLHKRVPNPMFLTKNGFWIAVQACGGDTEIVRGVRQALNQSRIQPGSLSGLGIVRDADDKGAGEQFDRLIHKLRELLPAPGYDLVLPSMAGEVAGGRPRFGIYIVPDCSSAGSVEDLLLECAGVVYPGLLAGAADYVDNVDRTLLTADDVELIEKPAGPKKATVACVASILKPGMSLAASIDQNRWLDDQSRQLPHVQALSRFLEELCGLS